MSKFTQIDNTGRLWQVQDLLPPEQCREILNVDWSALPVIQQPLQHFKLRRQICLEDLTVRKISQYITATLSNINQSVGTDFVECGGHFWIDYAGFHCPMHTDGQLANAMQIYWHVPGTQFGTGFYNYKTKNSLLYQFASVPNSGYIMLNHLNADGSQPLQWHAMFNPVPEGYIRVSSYWQFK